MEKHEGTRDEIDLVQLVKVLIKRKWIIIGGTLLITLMAVIITALLPRVYESQGFFQLGRGVDPDLNELKEIQDKVRRDIQENMMDTQTLQNTLLLDQTLQETGMIMMNVSLPDYKKYASQFTNPNKFLNFIKEKIKPGNIEANTLLNKIHTFEDIEQMIEPVYAYSKKDLKEVAQNAKDIKNFILGMQIRREDDSPEKARAFLEIFGEFVEDCILYVKLRDYIGLQINKSKTEAKKYDNIIINDEFKLRQLTVKRSAIEQIMKKFPGTDALMNRELLSLQNSGQRYLSPLAQIIGIESHIADIKENLALNQRNKQLTDLNLLFFLELQKNLANEPFGESSLAQCLKLTDTFFNKEEFSGDVIREVRNSLSVDLDNITMFKEEMKFISGPTLPKTAIRPKKLLIVAVGFVLGFFLSIIAAFFMNWWTLNKKQILNENTGGQTPH